MNAAGAPAGRRSVRDRLGRRGVASVLAMMFLVMFGALSVAMAVASQGNLRTASTHLHVIRAMGAAETGMAIAEKQLADAVSRFVVEKGSVNGDFGWRLWQGQTRTEDGRITVLSAPNGRLDTVSVRGLADALLSAHMNDQNAVNASGLPRAAGVFTPSGTTDLAVYKGDNWVRTAVIGIDADASAQGARPGAYQITYAPLANGTDVRVIVTGYSSIGASGSDYHYQSSSADGSARPVTRVIQQDFRVVKRPQHALLSPSRIMIGKNVLVSGNLGARYTDVTKTNGDPLETKSDFDKLDSSLDSILARFRAGCKQYDVDGDNRLRVGHPIESQGLPGVTELQSKGWSASAFADSTRDGYVDEFDLFINRYDVNHDGDVVCAASLTNGTTNQGRSPEFTTDTDLALLIDASNPDRNRNGIYGYANGADNFLINPSSALLDPDDRVLGFRDGVLNYKDQYAKIRGRLMFKTTSSAWASARGGSYSDKLQGPVAPKAGESATRFNATDNELPDVTSDTLAASQTPLKTAADGSSFATQVATQLGISSAQLATYQEQGVTAAAPKYWRADLADSYVYSKTGRHIYEKMPFNSPSYSDFYYRPRYENMTFRNVQIPMGTNALFINCKFIGVTYVRTYTDNTHQNWSLYGQLTWDTGTSAPKASTSPLDKSDFARYTTGNVADGPANYASFPDPPVINGSTKTGTDRNTKLYSNNVRFHDCVIVGSVVSDTPTNFTNLRNKLQFTGATRFTTTDPDNPDDAAKNPDPEDLPEIQKSSLMAPNYSVDIGSFNAPTDTYEGAPSAQNVQLQGTVVAGVLDVRGTARIDGALFMTYAPVYGQGPMLQNGAAVGNPANFNCTLGYFGSESGDGEAVDPQTLPIVNGKRIVGYDTDGDGIADVNSDQPQPAGSTPIPFYGYGRVDLVWNPDIPMPDGIMLPLSTQALRMTYREGK